MKRWLFNLVGAVSLLLLLTAAARAMSVSRLAVASGAIDAAACAQCGSHAIDEYHP
jgi:hypothetical protein